jgi:hypothetical protein
LNVYFEKKFKWNKAKIKLQKTALLKKINSVIKKTSNKHKVNTLKYLWNNL